MPLPFKLLTQVVTLGFQPPEDGFISLRGEAQQLPPESHLLLNQLQSAPGRVVLQSKTGGTVAVFRGGTASMQTQFFGDFAAIDAKEQRLEYAVTKTTALLKLIVKCGIRPLYADVGTVARLSGAGFKAGYPRLVDAVTSAFHLQGPLSEGERPFDFTLRVSRECRPTSSRTSTSRPTRIVISRSPECPSDRRC